MHFLQRLLPAIGHAAACPLPRNEAWLFDRPFRPLATGLQLRRFQQVALGLQASQCLQLALSGALHHGQIDPLLFLGPSVPDEVRERRRSGGARVARRHGRSLAQLAGKGIGERGFRRVGWPRSGVTRRRESLMVANGGLRTRGANPPYGAYLRQARNGPACVRLAASFEINPKTICQCSGKNRLCPQSGP